jgi:hypothetical protein
MPDFVTFYTSSCPWWIRRQLMLSRVATSNRWSNCGSAKRDKRGGAVPGDKKMRRGQAAPAARRFRYSPDSLGPKSRESRDFRRGAA